MKQGGTVANRHGAAFEESIAGRLSSRGYREMTSEERREFGITGTSPPAPCFARQVSPYRNLYNAKFKLDFFVVAENFPEGLIIEVKYQGSNGSVDEKYVFTVLSLKKLPGHKVFLMAGNGARADAVNWIKRNQNKDFTYLRVDDFIPWAEMLL